MGTMEHSSPLAAMNPPGPVIFGGCLRSEATTSSYPVFPVKRFGPESFNFKDLSMKNTDYFNVKPVRGSSPAASLAADLSQNFHIDQSPQLVTPRRSLFSANLFGPENGRENLSTPPLPSSSPAIDVMDMSPLPHKTPFSLNRDMELDSPTADVSMAKSHQQNREAGQESPFEVPRSGGEQEKRRRKPPMLRPSLMRTKALSANLQGSPAPQDPPFKFGAGAEGRQGSTLSLQEMFSDSPPREGSKGKSQQESNPMGPPRPRPPLSGAVGKWRGGNESPAPNAGRRDSNPHTRPKKLSRRSLSMFEHPDEVLNQDEDSGLTSSPNIKTVGDIETVPPLHLPHFTSEDQHDCLPRIENEVLVDVINGKYKDRYANTLIIDCRFQYEYDGGHIDGALNYNDKDSLAAELFDGGVKSNTVLVFHCEYSAHRAPIMAKFIRHKDRAVNIDEYPKLSYPEMYVLHGGYSAFFANHRSMCIPQNYVEMNAKEYEYACERGLGKVKQRSKLSRAQTFAFGQDTSQIEDSPTGRCRPTDRNSCLDDTSGSPLDADRLPCRRMFTY